MEEESFLGIIPDAGVAEEDGAARESAGGWTQGSVAVEGQAADDNSLRGAELESQEVRGDMVRVTVQFV